MLSKFATLFTIIYFITILIYDRKQKYTIIPELLFGVILILFNIFMYKLEGKY